MGRGFLERVKEMRKVHLRGLRVRIGFGGSRSTFRGQNRLTLRRPSVPHSGGVAFARRDAPCSCASGAPVPTPPEWGTEGRLSETLTFMPLKMAPSVARLAPSGPEGAHPEGG